MITSKNYTELLIQVSLTEFTFITKSKLSNEITSYKKTKLTTLEPIEKQLDAIFSQQQELKATYDDIHVYHDSRLNTFVPQAIFDENAMGSYLQYTTKVFATDFFAFDKLDTYQMNNVYVPFMNINNYLIDKFGTFTYHHLSTPLVNQVLDRSKNNSSLQLFVHFQEQNFEIIIAQDSKLKLFNTFTYQEPEDFIYYILFTYEQLELNPDQDKLSIFGSIQQSHKAYQLAYKYIRHVEIIETKAFFSDKSDSAKALTENFILLNT